MSQQTSDDSQQTSKGQDKEQPLVQHLLELRGRILKSLVAVLVVFAGLFYFANDIYVYISEPLRASLPEGSTMIATEVASPFLAPFKLTIVLSLFIAIPFILHQAWGFIAPGLYRHEKVIAIPLLVASIVLFYLGIAFAYYVVFPLIFSFFTTVGPESVTVMTDINSYLDFILKLFFAFGIAFEIPVATVLLVWSGVTTVESLKEKRPYVVVGCFVIGMIMTPPDVISQSLLAIPMWLLFECGILFARFVKSRKPDEAEA
ncbi:twin-arginine translocase subunit TatC [Endozoicomonas sp. GU-1]|uniref:twin-arginine translocase subunit TatC n=1 Tax=Endozoicomonas sp. GU-1 TaxID=3009078 RepID=UPI0022B48233|nr:twin-arginine translocase subunit TatC [Endozoicomonas sp. GU-1]WBA82965.1 twin-arginine translocase subunit TatC [Endozoicomonas sp. GU-1]WBA85891.1 twin-arginine translocase subunit TatC [Endozoicomonas sp. GU-1]